MLASEKTKRADKIVVIVPPRNSHDPRLARRADREKDTKMRDVARSVVGMIDGSIKITCSSKGPNPSPEQNENPIRKPRRIN